MIITYQKALKEANKILRKNNKESSAAKLLLLHFSNLSPTDLYIMYEKEMSKDKYNEFIEAIKLYAEKNIPVQHIMGFVYFYGYKFIVNDKVLIPRFETEELVANVLILYDKYFENKNIKLLDVGTGSGCLAITLQLEEPNHIKVFATDISEEALEVAKQNADNLNASVTFLKGNMLEPIRGDKFDILVSNPPYIPEREEVDDIIIDNEPHVALFGGEDGLKFYREILSNALDILNSQSIIAFEHGYDKAKDLKQIVLKYFPNAFVYTMKDMQNKDRMTFVINGF